MKIEDILNEKLEIVLSSDNPQTVKFTLEELNTICDTSNLRELKLNVPFPVPFEKSTNIFDCHHRILSGDSIYRVLEFCILRNPYAKEAVRKVFREI